MTDPIRRDPVEFLRVLKKMAHQSSWQKSMIFASKGRMVGYRLTLEHYNTVLFSQSIWGRALEIVRVVRAMNEDQVQMNGASYYYLCNGMANADHGMNYDFKVNHRLEKLQHWRVAIDALQACEYNGFDTTDTMHNSTIITCTIPGINRWREALHILHKMNADDRKIHPNMVKYCVDCLMRNRRPKEASALVRMAAAQRVEGYANCADEADVFTAAERRNKTTKMVSTTTSSDDLKAPPPLLKEEREAVESEESQLSPFTSGLHSTEINTVFRPRVHRQLWYRWHAIANKYRPGAALKKKQLAPRDSPTGVPAFYRL